MISGEYLGLRREILDNTHGTFILYFTHSENYHSNQERTKVLVEYSNYLPSSVRDIAEPYSFHLFQKFIDVWTLCLTCKEVMSLFIVTICHNSQYNHIDSLLCGWRKLYRTCKCRKLNKMKIDLFRCFGDFIWFRFNAFNDLVVLLHMFSLFLHFYVFVICRKK